MICKLLSGCKNKVFREFEYCALHCSDFEYWALHCLDKEIEDRYIDIDGYLVEFSNLFMKYVFDKLKITFIPDYFRFRENTDNENIVEKIRKSSIFIENIVFPKDYNESSRYLNVDSIIKDLGRIVFNGCHFNYISFNNISNIYYEHCKFNEDIDIHPPPRVTDEKGEEVIKYRYLYCYFNENVNILPSIFSNDIYCNIFESCNFEKDIIISNLTIKKNLFLFPDPLKNSSIDTINSNFERVKSYYRINNVSITNCTFESDFKINGLDNDYLKSLKSSGCTIEESILTINSLNIEDTKFESKVEIK